uniref:Uncharacterized protein n=1 Tax=Sander lucioperca TaxID=283035 RepID=A0A8D0CQT2_SANLU
MCLVRSPFSAQHFPQKGQLNGFSPVCTRMCFLRSVFCAQPFPQTEQLKGFSPVWYFMCRLRCWLMVNFFPQTSQVLRRRCGCGRGESGGGAAERRWTPDARHTGRTRTQPPPGASPRASSGSLSCDEENPLAPSCLSVHWAETTLITLLYL